ncbi:MAG: PKD domain-containing protein [Gemmatimonas sp.]
MRTALATLSLLILVACGGGDGGTQPIAQPPTQPDTPAQIAILAGDGQVGEPGQPLPVKPTVVVKDASGRALQGIVVSFAVDTGGGSVAVAVVATGSDGAASTNWILGPAEGTAVLRITAAGLADVRVWATARFAMLTLVDALTVPASGGTVTYAKPGDQYSGVRLSVPSGGYSTSTTFTVQVDRTVQPVLPADVKQIGSAFVIQNGKGFAELPMSLQLPVRVGADSVVGAFFFDPATGTLESAPTVARDDSSITIATRHFSADQLLSNGSATSMLSQPMLSQSIAPSAFGRVTMILVATTPARLNLPISSGFQPGTDDWEFSNLGTFSGDGGICAGMSISELYYYFAVKPRGLALNHRYDSFSNLEFDNPRGERFATALELAGDWPHARNWLRTIADYAQQTRVSYPQIVYQSLAMAILVTHQPQLIALTSPPAIGGHSVVAYAVNNGVVLYADPNSPGIAGLTMRYANGAFAPVQRSTRAGDPPEIFNTVQVIGISAMINMTTVKETWDEFERGGVFAGYFPPVRRQMYDIENEAWVDIPASGAIFTTHRILALRTLCPLCPAWRTDAPTSRVFTGIKDTTNVTRGTDALATDSAAVMVFGTGRGSFRVSMESFHTTTHTFIDQQWLSITAAPVTISPAPAAGTLNVNVDFVLQHNALATPGSTFTWTFGDGTAAVIKTVDSTVVHRWTTTGNFTVTAELKDAGGRRIAIVTTTATITGAISPAPAEGVANSDFNFVLHHAGIPGAGATFTWDFGDASGSVTKTSDSTIVHQWNTVGVYTLTATMRSANGTIVLQDQTTVTIDGTPSIHFEVAGPWDPYLTAPNGTYAFDDYVGNLVSQPTPNVDALLLLWDRNLRSGTSGVTVLIVFPTGAPVTRGMTFTKFQGTGGPITKGEFQLVVAVNPSDPDGYAFPPKGTGSLTFTGVGRLSNGYYVGQFTFTLTNAQGGTITGGGVAKWQ